MDRITSHIVVKLHESINKNLHIKAFWVKQLFILVKIVIVFFGNFMPNDISIAGCFPIGSRPDAQEEESRLI